MATKNTPLSGRELYEIAIKIQEDEKIKRNKIVNEVLEILDPLIHGAIVQAANTGSTDGTETVRHKNDGEIVHHDDKTKTVIINALQKSIRKNYDIYIRILEFKSKDCFHINEPKWELVCKFVFNLPRPKELAVL